MPKLLALVSSMFLIDEISRMPCEIVVVPVKVLEPLNFQVPPPVLADLGLK